MTQQGQKGPKKKRGSDPELAALYPDEPMPRKFPTVYPLVASIIDPTAMAAGQFIGSRPQGVTVHYSADRDLKRTIKSLQDRHLGYHLIIDRDGKVYQTCYLDRRVSHAGPSEWRKLGCNRWHAAVCLISWGEVKKKSGKIYSAWNGAELIDEDIDGKDIARRPANVGGALANWDAATDAQEGRLLEVLRWFIACKVDPRNICGHDEAAIPPGRKIDPGGVLSFSMEDIRNALCDEAGVPL